MIVIKARAKVNLALDVLSKRANGYHEVRMIMQAVELADEVTVAAGERGIEVSCSREDLDCGPDNLAWKAAALLAQHAGVAADVRIHLNKRIPLAAGLAGGSADAAAVLSGLNRLWRLGLSPGDLEEVGALLGSDVPFCLRGGTALATGRGERLRTLPDAPVFHMVLAKPRFEVSTAWVYGRYRPETVQAHPDIDGMIAAIRAGDRAAVAGRLGNVLETVTVTAFPEIGRIKQTMLSCGAVASLMSGSGPTVFGLAESPDHAGEMAARLRNDTAAEIIVTKTAPREDG